MNTGNIKKYAPKARREFMEAVVNRLNYFGISANKNGELQIVEANLMGSVMQIGGNSFDGKWVEPRRRLVCRSQKVGFNQLVEHVAYTWFNRLCAIRFMELHGYLGHGFRVLSHPDNAKGFEILDHAQDLADELGLDRASIIELKLAGNKDEELYRALLLGQCHKLHEAMPFLFEALDDETELLLPDNLTRTDSILRGLVDGIPEEDWRQVESIGWLYQFYISEKKDEVIGKVVKSEDIPAATQLFTPNWIVKYLVQNSVARHWLQTYPDSDIKSKMEYYIEPAKQTPEVIEQLKAITQESIEPESIKVIDPACGSGHILVEAYNVLKAIYEERGYRSREIPKLILENNLFGLDIDDRAVQLAGFSLIMMARNDDKHIFTRGIKLNVLSLQESLDVNLPRCWRVLNLSGSWQCETSKFAEEIEDISLFNADNSYQLIKRTLDRFIQAKTFGSLIEIPEEEHDDLLRLFITLKEVADSDDLMRKSAANVLIPYIHQALLLAQRYDAVIANPPYMGNKGMNAALKKYLKENFIGYERDLFSAFIIQNLKLARNHGQLGFMTPFVWMFISSFEQLREKLINDEIISTLVQLEYSGFDGATVPICTFTLTKGYIPGYKSCYIRLSGFRGSAKQAPKTLEAIHKRECGWFFEAKQDEFKKITGSPIGYWISPVLLRTFTNNKILDVAQTRVGCQTSDNNRFLRLWFEVSTKKSKYDAKNKEEAESSSYKWFPYNKGGSYRKWYGNQEYVINWENAGEEIFAFARGLYGSPTRTVKNGSYYFRSSVTWSKISSGIPSFRWQPAGAVFDVAGASVFLDTQKDEYALLAQLNSSIALEQLKIISPTLNYETSQIASLPCILNKVNKHSVCALVEKLIFNSKYDWDMYDTSWNFRKNPLLQSSCASLAYQSLTQTKQDLYAEQKNLENQLDSIISMSFGVDNFTSEYTGEVSLFANLAYKYSGLDDAQNRNQSDTFVDFMSYAIGCMMGRYSLDRESLVYAHENNEGFYELVAEGAYESFPPDEDGIIALTDQEWFKDDATNKFRDFVKVVWGEEHLQENLDFVAKSLCLYAIKSKKSESAMETIRRYFSIQFYKDHLKIYKKRPIYWLFSSGKHKAFECLVYLHRYNESTLSRMRTQYVTPLLGKYDAYSKQLKKQIEHAESTAEVNRLKKDLDSLIKKHMELSGFDDKLKHYADMRISINLDDGVKVNYGKFSDLLSDVKAITGSTLEAD